MSRGRPRARTASTCASGSTRSKAPRVSDEVGQDKVVQRHDDGSIEFGCASRPSPPSARGCSDCSDHAEILAPPAFRDRVGGLARGTPRRPPATDAAPSPCSLPRTREADDRAPGRSWRPGARPAPACASCWPSVGWLAQVGEAPISEAAARFGMGEEELVRELELAACCGMPPYTPDALMEIEVSDTTVRAFLPAEFARPRPFDPGRGLRGGGVGPAAAGRAWCR